MAMSSCTSSASRGSSGNDFVEDLHALTAQVRKLRVRIFISTALRVRFREAVLHRTGRDRFRGFLPGSVRAEVNSWVESSGGQEN